MTVNLAWRDAMNAAGHQFTAEERANGWSETMQPKQLAALQRPFEWRDRTGRNAFNVLLQAIEDDCRMGSIHSTAEEVRICTKPAQDVVPSLFDLAYGHPDQYTREGIPYAYTKPAEFKDITRHHIAAQDFAAWLAAQGEEPSPHITAWFKARGVAAAQAGPVPAAEQAAPPEPVQAAPAAEKEPSQGRTRRRRDLLAPLVEKAQRECSNPSDSAEVFALLRNWAQIRPPLPPLFGVTEDGCIQWRDSNDNPKELSIDALRGRINRRDGKQ